MGFEPTRAEPNGLAVHRLNHSATSSCAIRPGKLMCWTMVAQTTLFPFHIICLCLCPRKRIDVLSYCFVLPRMEYRHTDIVWSHFVAWVNTCKLISCIFVLRFLGKNLGSTEIWTRIAGFKVQSANHYTIEPKRRGWDSNPRGQSPLD